jgi:hypothetical protein
MRVERLLLVALALLGFAVPRSFLLLYVCFGTVLWMWRSKPTPPLPWLLRWSAAWLLLFGLAYVLMQGVWRVWSLSWAWLPEIAAVVLLPPAALLSGWLLGQWGSRQGSRTMVVYALGCLAYAILCLALSRTPWWNLAQTFDTSIRVPWGPEAWRNVRSVEQRGFLAFALLPVAWALLGAAPPKRLHALLLVVVAGLGWQVTWATQGRLGYAALLIASVPWLLVLRPMWLKGIALLVASSAAAMAWARGWLCDERYALMMGFVRRMPQAIWGGRQLDFAYASCAPIRWLQFGTVSGSNASLVHNVVLDVYNDGGIVPFFCLLVAMLPLLWFVMRGFVQDFARSGCSPSWGLRWSLFSVLLIEWIFQPLLYSDQQMFVMSFVFLGFIVAEFRLQQSFARHAS